MGLSRRHPTRKFPGKLGTRPDKSEWRKAGALAREALRGRVQQAERLAREP